MSRIVLLVLLSVFILSQCKPKSSMPESEHTLMEKGYKKLRSQEYQEAIRLFTSILDLNPENAEAYIYRGLCKYHIEDYDGALTDYNKAIEYQSNYAEAYSLRGLVKGEKGDKKGACEDWEKAFEFGLKSAFILIKEFCLDKE